MLTHQISWFHTHINVEMRRVEYLRRGVVRGDVPVELLAVPVPLDGVQFVSLEVVVAPQFGRLAADGVVGDVHVQEADAQAGRGWKRYE